MIVPRADCQVEDAHGRGFGEGLPQRRDPLQTRLEGHPRDKRFIGIAAHTWNGKIEHEKMPSGAEFDFKIALRPHDETFHHIVLPQVRHTCARWRSRDTRAFLMW